MSEIEKLLESGKPLLVVMAMVLATVVLVLRGIRIVYRGRDRTVIIDTGQAGTARRSKDADKRDRK